MDVASGLRPPKATGPISSPPAYPRFFRGDPEQSLSFMGECRHFLAHYDQSFQSEEDKVTFVVMLLRTPASDWAADMWASPEGLPHSIQGFWDLFLLNFGPRQGKVDAAGPPAPEDDAASPPAPVGDAPGPPAPVGDAPGLPTPQTPALTPVTPALTRETPALTPNQVTPALPAAAPGRGCCPARSAVPCLFFVFFCI